MIYNYPYFGFTNYYNPNTMHTNNPSINQPPPKNFNYNYHKNNSQNQNFYMKQDPIEDHAKKEDASHLKKDTTSPLLNILGISLYFDDILLICLILFLSNEKINDNYLLLALILLLLN